MKQKINLNKEIIKALPNQAKEVLEFFDSSSEFIKRELVEETSFEL